MLLTYVFVLNWREWWQYVLAAVAAAALCLYFASMMAKDAETGRRDEAMLNLARYLTIGQLAGMVIAMVGMIIDDKMPRDPGEPDWAANAIFFFGAAALAAISLNALWGPLRAADVARGMASRATNGSGMPLRPMLPGNTSRFRVEHPRVPCWPPRVNAGAPLALAAGLFTVQMLFAVVRTNAPFGERAIAQALDAGWAWSNTVLAALVYAWGAAAMFAVYSLSGLAWRHWWQYGAGMTLLGVGGVVVCQLLTRRRAPHDAAKIHSHPDGRHGRAGCVRRRRARLSRRLRQAHTQKPDWAANHIFIAGGCHARAGLARLAADVTARYAHASASPQPSA